jgi:hypothetical protein
MATSQISKIDVVGTYLTVGITTGYFLGQSRKFEIINDACIIVLAGLMDNRLNYTFALTAPRSARNK